MKNQNYKSIVSWALACAAINVPEQLPDASGFPDLFKKQVLDNYQLMVVTKAVNGEWEPTMETTEERHFPVFWIKERASGRGLAILAVNCDGSATGVGPRLVCETEEQAQFVADTFLSLYEEYLLRY